MKAAWAIVPILGLMGCVDDMRGTRDTVEMAVAKQALTDCAYDILPRAYYQTRFRGYWSVQPSQIATDGVPIVTARNGADQQRLTQINTCVRNRTLASPDFQKARARAAET